MSKLYGSIEGDVARTEATRTANHRVEGHVRGWDIGVRVIGSHYKGENEFALYTTGGSNKPNDVKFIGKVMMGPSGPVFIP